METEQITEEQTEIVPYEDDGKERLTHMINPPANVHIWRDPMTSKDVVDIARMTGDFVVTLCGRKIYPKHNPKVYPRCQECIDIAVGIIDGGGKV